MQENLPVNIPFHSILNHLEVPVIVVDTSRLIVYATPSAEKTFDYKPGKMHGMDLIRILPEMDIERTGDMQFEHATAGAFRVSVTPIKVDDAIVGNLLSIHTETGTIPVEQTDAYKKLTEYMEAVFHASSDGIWLTDGKGMVLNVNTASESLNSISAGDVIGKHVKDLVKNGIIDKSATLEVLKKKRRVSILQHVTKTGRQLIVTGTPTFDEKGRRFA